MTEREEKIVKLHKNYWEKRQKMLDQRFNKTNKQVLKELKREYRRIWNDIEKEIQAWYLKDIKNPNFKWSELHDLEDTQRAIGLLLDELYDIEKTKLADAMDEVYISSYQDMSKLTESYFNGLDKVVPNGTSYLGLIEETNRVASMTGLEQMLRNEIDMSHLSSRIWLREDILKHELDWYKGFAGDKFANRIDRRRAIVKNEINQAIRDAFVKGSSVDKCTKNVLDRLDVSYSNAKRLAFNELTHAQLCADARQCKENGFKGVKRVLVKDEVTCEICLQHEGEIVPINEYYDNPSSFQLHVNCRDMPCPLMTVDRNSPLSFEEFHKLHKQGNAPTYEKKVVINI